jgi:vitamin B12 transporter
LNPTRIRSGVSAARACPGVVLAAAVAVAAQVGTAHAQPSGDDRLDEIVVTASGIEQSRRQIGAAMSVITGDEAQLRGYDSLVDVMRTQPGIGVSNSGGAGKSTSLRIRGEEAYRTLLVIDGVKALDTGSPQVAPVFDSLLLTSELDRIEVLRGPQGFVYGADAGGVVNVITRRGEGGFGGHVGLESGSYGLVRREAGVGGAGDLLDYVVTVTDLEVDGFNAQSADDVLRDADGAANTTVHAKLGWQLGDATRVQLVARSVDAETMLDGCFSLQSFATTHDCFDTTDQTTYRLSLEHSGERMFHSVAYSDIDTRRESFAEGSSAFTSDGGLARFEYLGSFEASPSTTLVYGIDLQTETVRSDGLQERDQRAVYFEYQAQFDRRFFVSVGARRDDNEDFGTHTSARVSAAYLPAMGAGTIKLRTSYGTGFRAPSLFEIAYNRGPFAFPPAAGSAPREEQSAGFDVGVEYDAPEGLHLELSYFEHEITDEIYFDLIGFSGYLQSLGVSRSEGFELGFDVPLGGRWQLLGNWTTNEARDTDNQQRLRRPKRLANIGVSYVTAESWSFIANYRLARDALDIGGAALDDYGVLDVAVTRPVGAHLELRARLENLTDEQYREVIGYNTAGRSGYVGVRLRF